MSAEAKRLKRRPLAASFFRASTVDLANQLIGCCLVHDGPEGRTAGRIVETEAYLSEGDPASHSHRGRTKRNASMFEEPGLAYVYLIYGMHQCLNLVSAEAGVGEAVLIRALEPLCGIELMRERRQRQKLADLCSGPAKLTQAMGVGLEHDGVDLRSGPLQIWSPTSSGDWDGSLCIRTAGPRIGISKGKDLPLRFTWENSPWLSAGSA